MEYYFNELDASNFQRLVNAVLNKRFGEHFRTTPLQGPDGGRDGETAPNNPFFTYKILDTEVPLTSIDSPPAPGRYLFQVKHHQTTDTRITDARRAVLNDFEQEMRRNVLGRIEDENVNFFILITNVPSSADALDKLDKKRKQLLKNTNHLHADIWWKEHLTAFLDRMPDLWVTYPEIFAGRKVPFLATLSSSTKAGGLSRAARIAISKEFERDKVVKFRQIGLEKELARLFVDLDVIYDNSRDSTQRLHQLAALEYRDFIKSRHQLQEEPKPEYENDRAYINYRSFRQRGISALFLLLFEESPLRPEIGFGRKILLEGGPGQGKSTVTQMAIQIYRQQLLNESHIDPEGRWKVPLRNRLPFRVELRRFAEWLSDQPDSSVERFLAEELNKLAGSDQVTAESIHDMVEHSPVLLVFDGMDEIGQDEWRDKVLTRINDCISTFEKHLGADLKVVITTRPPAVVGHREQLADFTRLTIASLDEHRVDEYLNRWLSVHIADDAEESTRIRGAFGARRREAFVSALIRNPMQLSVLLHFIKLKDEAFPDNRARLYKEYFTIVIDRDVTKSPELRLARDLVEGLHEFLGYKIHSLTEAQQSDGTLSRAQLLEMVGDWLSRQGTEVSRADELFRLGEDRLGLIVTARGEGREARYGYEIQPVREYFAAAYINNQISGDANAAFEQMVRRPFWREVALFLAGLRRPNEIADLVSRARYLDEDEVNGWRQEGRSILLQLLEEGVFAARIDVLELALETVLDLLDTRKIKVQNEPDSFLRRLVPILQGLPGHPTRKVSEDLVRLLEDFDEEPDKQTLFRVYSAARYVVDESYVRRMLLEHKTSEWNLRAMLRIYWPHQLKIDMHEASKNVSFWEGVPDHVWAHWWWLASLIPQRKMALEVPPSIHKYLLNELATDSNYQLPYRVLVHGLERPTSQWAVWRLAYLMRLMHLSLTMPSSARDKLTNSELSQLPEDYEYVGLDEDEEDLLRTIIEIFEGLWLVTMTGTKPPLATLAHEASSLVELMQRQGLKGWVACRCSTQLLLDCVASEIEREGGNRASLSTLFEDNTQQNGELTKLVAAIFEYYDLDPASLASQPWIPQFGFFANARMPYLLHFGMPHIMPSRIRLQNGGALVDFVSTLASVILGKINNPFNLDIVHALSYDTSIVRQLVDECAEQLPMLLRTMSSMRFTGAPIGRPLLTSRMNQILKLARDTDEAQILQGALIALSTSKFVRSAGPDLLIKMLRAAASNPDIARSLFALKDPDLFESLKITDELENEILQELAARIVNAPELYSFELVTIAAGYLAQNSPLGLTPLINLEDDLKLYVERTL